MDNKNKKEEKINIKDLADKYGIRLKKVGSLWQGLCPFHSDKKTKSFTIYSKTNSFYCFGCGVGGDIFKFISLIKNISYAEAIKELSYR